MGSLRNYVTQYTLIGSYPEIKDGFQREEASSQKCINSTQEICAFTIQPTIVQFKVPKIDDALSKTFHLTDCSSPVLGNRLCSIVQYGQNYYKLTSTIPTYKLQAAILYGGLATVIGTIAVALVWVKYGSSKQINKLSA